MPVPMETAAPVKEASVNSDLRSCLIFLQLHPAPPAHVTTSRSSIVEKQHRTLHATKRMQCLRRGTRGRT
eukprot:2973209-Rhodomonas_salina.2